MYNSQYIKERKWIKSLCILHLQKDYDHQKNHKPFKWILITHNNTEFVHSLHARESNNLDRIFLFHGAASCDANKNTHIMTASNIQLPRNSTVWSIKNNIHNNHATTRSLKYQYTRINNSMSKFTSTGRNWMYLIYLDISMINNGVMVICLSCWC